MGILALYVAQSYANCSFEQSYCKDFNQQRTLLLRKVSDVLSEIGINVNDLSQCALLNILLYGDSRLNCTLNRCIISATLEYIFRNWSNELSCIPLSFLRGKIPCQLRIALKMAAKNFLPRCIAFEVQIFDDSIGIQLKNALHLGKKFLTAIFSAILYCKISTLRSSV